MAVPMVRPMVRSMVHDGGVELIAHRAGNLSELVAPAVAVADAIEVDVHLFRNRLEVRHAKILLWPWSRLWEKWEILPRTSPRPPLAAIVGVVPGDARLWLDLKGFTTRLPRAVHRVVGDRPGTTYSTRHWWVLGWVRRHTTARTMRSVGNRWQRWLVVRLPATPAPHGVVIHERLLDPEWILRLRRVAPTLVAWAVDDRARGEELLAAGIDGLILDDLELIRTLRG